MAASPWWYTKLFTGSGPTASGATIVFHWLDAAPGPGMGPGKPRGDAPAVAAESLAHAASAAGEASCVMDAPGQSD